MKSKDDNYGLTSSILLEAISRNAGRYFYTRHFGRQRKEGREEGREEGRIEGHKEGLLEGKFITLFNLVKAGLLSVSAAAKESELSEEDFTVKMKEAGYTLA